MKDRTERAIESMRKQIQEGNEKISSYNPYFSPNAAIITANQFVEMLQSKKSYCNIMNQLARELKVGCEFKIKDGVIDIEIRRESEKMSNELFEIFLDMLEDACYDMDQEDE